MLNSKTKSNTKREARTSLFSSAYTQIFYCGKYFRVLMSTQFQMEHSCGSDERFFIFSVLNGVIIPVQCTFRSFSNSKGDNHKIVKAIFASISLAVLFSWLYAAFEVYGKPCRIFSCSQVLFGIAEYQLIVMLPIFVSVS
jgi:hypothetical protein